MLHSGLGGPLLLLPRFFDDAAVEELPYPSGLPGESGRNSVNV